MSDTAILLSVALVGGVMLAAIIYVIVGTRRNARAKAEGRETYRWEPAQDYDVVLDQEMPMTPPYPKLRDKNGNPPREEDLRRW